MPVAGEEQRAFVENRQLTRRPGAKLLVVHVAAEAAGHRRAAASPSGRRRGGDNAEKRIERNLQSPRHHADIAIMVDRRMDGFVFGEFVRQGAEQRQDGYETPVLAHLHAENIDLKHVAGLRALHIDRPGDEMRSGPLHQRIERCEIVGRHQAFIFRQGFLATCREGMQRDGVAGGDLEYRRRGAVEITPNHIFGRRRNLMAARHGLAPLLWSWLQMAIYRLSRSRLDDSMRPASATVPRDSTTNASARLTAKSRNCSTRSRGIFPFKPRTA